MLINCQIDEGLLNKKAFTLSYRLISFDNLESIFSFLQFFLILFIETEFISYNSHALIAFHL